MMEKKIHVVFDGENLKERKKESFGKSGRRWEKKIFKMDHRELGRDWLHEDREGYNVWVVVSILMIYGFRKIRGIVTSCGNMRFSKMNPLQGFSNVFIRAATCNRTTTLSAP
jgi:hypothetical protein